MDEIIFYSINFQDLRTEQMTTYDRVS